MPINVSISGVQFLTAMIAIAVGFTGLVTAIVANQRLRAERAILVVQAIRSIRSADIEIDLVNVGVRAALSLIISAGLDTKVVAGGLQNGEIITVLFPAVDTAILTFHDAAVRKPQKYRIDLTTGGIPLVEPY